MTPHWATQSFLALLQVLSLRVVFLQDLKVLRQDVRQLMAASPVIVFLLTTLLVEMEGVDAADCAAPEADETVTAAGTEPLGVFDWEMEGVWLACCCCEEAATWEAEMEAAAWEAEAAAWEAEMEAAAWEPWTEEAATWEAEMEAAAWEPWTEEAAAWEPWTEEAAAWDAETETTTCDEPATDDAITEVAAIDEAASDDAAKVDGANESEPLTFVVMTIVPVIWGWMLQWYPYDPRRNPVVFKV